MSITDSTSLLERAEPSAVRLGFVTGLIQTERLNSFERILFRATRGNMFLRTVNSDMIVPNVHEYALT